VMDFSGCKPCSFAEVEEVVHGAGGLKHGYCCFDF
jgi:hypothetical protein